MALATKRTGVDRRAAPRGSLLALSGGANMLFKTPSSRMRQVFTGKCLVAAILTALAAVATGSVRAGVSTASRPAFGPDASATTHPASAPAESITRAYILPIRGEISDITHDSLKRRLNTIRDKDPELVVIELNTPGGSLAATMDICDMLKGLRDDGVKVYSWVNTQAYSAGTIIALATDGIVMARNSTIGDCQPIQMTPQGVSAIPEDIEAKATSPLKAELEDSARRNGLSYEVLLALINPQTVLFWLVNTETGERRLVDSRGRDQLFNLEDRRDGTGKGGLLEMFRGSGERDQRGDLDEVVPEDRSRTPWRYVKEDPVLGPVRQPVDKSNELLTMRTSKAIAFGFCEATINNEAELRAHFGVTGSFERLENTWLETAIEWLASPMVRGVLFMLMLMGAYAEFKAPGLGLAGGVALVALVLFLGAPYLAGTAVTWEIVVVVVGMILIVIEVFVIPGFGVIGIVGLILMGIGLLFSFAPPEPGFEREWPSMPTLQMTYDALKSGLYAIAAGLGGSVVGMYFIALYFPKLPVAGQLIAANPRREELQMDDPYPGTAQPGDEGVAESLLRPAGKARFGRMLVDVVSQGEYIENGSRIVVVERQGNRVVVRRVG